MHSYVWMYVHTKHNEKGKISDIHGHKIILCQSLPGLHSAHPSPGERETNLKSGRSSTCMSCVCFVREGGLVCVCVCMYVCMCVCV
jgi:hypothetical protein